MTAVSQPMVSSFACVLRCDACGMRTLVSGHLLMMCASRGTRPRPTMVRSRVVTVPRQRLKPRATRAMRGSRMRRGLRIRPAMAGWGLVVVVMVLLLLLLLLPLLVLLWRWLRLPFSSIMGYENQRRGCTSISSVGGGRGVRPSFG